MGQYFSVMAYMWLTMYIYNSTDRCSIPGDEISCALMLPITEVPIPEIDINGVLFL